MSDWIAAKIVLGGRIPRALLDELCEVIDGQGVSHASGDAHADAGDAREWIEQAAAKGETLELVDDDARYGEFPELEAFLDEHRLDYERHSDGKYEYDAVNVFRRGDLYTERYSTQNGRDLVTAEALLEVLDSEKSDAEKLAEIRLLAAPFAGLAPIQLVD